VGCLTETLTLSLAPSPPATLWRAKDAPRVDLPRKRESKKLTSAGDFLSLMPLGLLRDDVLVHQVILALVRAALIDGGRIRLAIPGSALKSSALAKLDAEQGRTCAAGLPSQDGSHLVDLAKRLRRLGHRWRSR